MTTPTFRSAVATRTSAQVPTPPPPVTVVIMTTTLPSATVGTAYSFSLAAGGGVAPYTWTVLGTLPAGITMSGSGVLVGTPTAAGTSPLTFTAVDSHSSTSAASSMPLVVNSSTAGAVTVSNTSLPAAWVGQAYTAQLAAQGGTPPYTFTATGQPAWMTVATNGAISGTPTATGSSTLAVTAKDATNTSSTATNLTVTASNAPTALTMLTTSLPGGTVGQAYSAQAQAAGGTPPYTWSLQFNSAWLTIDPNTGMLGGTPTATGQSVTYISVTDSAKPPISAQTGIIYFYIGSSAAILPANKTLPNAAAGAAYSSSAFTATGGTPPYTWTVTNAPAGITMASNGILSGTPTIAGSYTLTATAKDTLGATGSVNSTLTVTLGVTPTVLGPALVGMNYSASVSSALAVTGGTAPYTWSISGGPTGLVVNSSTGVLSGAPTAAGSFTLSITVHDSATTPNSVTITAPMQSYPGIASCVADTMWQGWLHSNELLFMWWPPAGSDAQGLSAPESYNVYRNGSQITSGVVGRKPNNSIFYWYWIDTGLTPSTNYSYTVRPVVCGVEGADSPAIALTTLGGQVSVASPPNLPTRPPLPSTWIVPYSLPTGGTTWTATITADTGTGVPGPSGPKNNVGCSPQYAFTNAQPGDVIVLTAGATYTNSIVNTSWTIPAKTGTGWIYIISSEDPGYKTGGALIPIDETESQKQWTPLTFASAPAAGATQATLAPNQSGLTDASGNWTRRNA